MTYDLKKSPLTLFLLLITILVFLAMQLMYGSLATSPQVVYHFGGMYGYIVKEFPDQLWRLITPIFIHIGWNHFIINSLTLFFIGQLAERIWGSRQFLLLYILSGIMGNIFTLFLSPNTVSAGASTSLFGLFAAIVILGLRSHNACLKDLAKSYQSLIIINLILNIFMPNVSLVGHVGGVVGGALASLFLPTKIAEESLNKKTQMASLLVYCAIIVLSIFLIIK
ncbi:rhomboid family intramembrane serine protease [Streptococcus catagoni]|uniref:rhomboid family intramembrane serine protease n=1 Tax=Streptococcus catagoni TaxID=2654874 RepID=UPI001407438D|nr:rhomboid family intramembrane serine protease [Streptococcus catagoni]